MGEIEVSPTITRAALAFQCTPAEVRDVLDRLSHPRRSYTKRQVIPMDPDWLLDLAIEAETAISGNGGAAH
jgi:hypothetical protein